MPFRCAGGRHQSGHERRDRARVRRQLGRAVARDFVAGGDFCPPESVAVCRVAVAGGTPGRQLPQVEYRGERAPRTPSPPPRQHGPDSLSDYKSSDDEDGRGGDGGGGPLVARRAAVLALRRRKGVPRSLDPTPEPYRRRRGYELSELRRKSREKGLI